MTNKKNKNFQIRVAIIVVTGIIMLIITVLFTPVLEKIRDSVYASPPPETPSSTLTSPTPPTNPTSTVEPSTTHPLAPQEPRIMLTVFTNIASGASIRFDDSNVKDNYGNEYRGSYRGYRTLRVNPELCVNSETW
jgi:hypothetical protein